MKIYYSKKTNKLCLVNEKKELVFALPVKSYKQYKYYKYCLYALKEGENNGK